MTGMAAKRPMGLIRGKVKVNESRKSKDRGNKPNGPTWQEWQPAGPWD